MIMIIDFLVDVNTYEEKILKNKSFLSYKCPKCCATHSFHRHGSYSRNVIYYKEGIGIVECKIDILRLKCISCNSTQAILPSDVIPYSIYCYSYVLNVLHLHYIDNKSIVNISNKSNISFQQIYNFIKTLTIFFERCLSLLRIKRIIKDIYKITHIELIAIIITSLKSLNFIISYFKEYRWMVLLKKYHNIIPCPIYIDINY
jgi:predicted DNA-binding protein YlxM (UPF0122 family)